MKRRIFSIFCTLALCLTLLPVTARAEGVKIDETNFPDATFRQFVLDEIDTDGDGYLSEFEAWEMKLDVSNQRIADLTGIDHFTALLYLYCSGNQLKSLDLSHNTALEILNCYDNQLTKLDLSHNTALLDLNCYDNQLTKLDLSKNAALTYLYCYDNQLTELDLSDNDALEDLYCSGQQVSRVLQDSTLDLSTVPGWEKAENIQVRDGTLSSDGKTVVRSGTAFVSTVTYDYPTGFGNNNMNVTLTIQWPDIPVTPEVPPAPSQEDDSEPNYSVSWPRTVEGGTVTVKKSYAEEGETFFFTLTPDEGYELDTLSVTDSRGRALDLTGKGGAYSFEMPAGAVEMEVSFRKIAVEPEKLPFTDVPENAWYAGGVRYMYENGLMAGVSDTAFGPNATTSRAMAATILWRMAGSPVVNYAMNFTDVDPAAWYAEAVRWAASEELISGYGDAFGTNDPITREELAVMLYRMARNRGLGFTGAWAFRLDYADANEVSDYAYEALCWTTMHGIITGMDGNLLSPQGQATRAQTAVMLRAFGETCGF